MAKLNGLGQVNKKPVEKRDLQGHGQTAADRVDAVFLIQLHNLLVHALLARIVELILFIPVLDTFHQRRDPLHLLRRLNALEFQREHRQIDDNRQQDDSPTVVMGPMVVNVAHGEEERLRDEAEPAEVYQASSGGLADRSTSMSFGATNIRNVRGFERGLPSMAVRALGASFSF